MTLTAPARKRIVTAALKHRINGEAETSMNPKMGFLENKTNYHLLSRLVLMHTSDFWNFHAAWFRFVDGSVESLSQRSHKHMLYELHYVLFGRLSIQLPHGRRLLLNSGDFLIIPPQMMHQITDEQPPSSKLVSGFDIQTENAQMLHALRLLEDGGVRHESKTLRQLVVALQTKMETSTLLGSSLSPFLVQSIILEMLEIILPQEACKMDVKLKTSMNDERIEAAKKLIQDQPNITGGNVAARLGISLRHLNRLCNASCGCSIHRLILEERIHKACILLESTSLSLTDISEITGYSSVYAFIRAFKAITGVSPGKYQKDPSRRG